LRKWLWNTVARELTKKKIYRFVGAKLRRISRMAEIKVIRAIQARVRAKIATIILEAAVMVEVIVEEVLRNG
jgi:hypothetical protein